MATIEPEAVFAGLGAVCATAWGFEIGFAFLMRVTRETFGGGHDD